MAVGFLLTSRPPAPLRPRPAARIRTGMATPMATTRTAGLRRSTTPGVPPTGNPRPQRRLPRRTRARVRGRPSATASPEAPARATARATTRAEKAGCLLRDRGVLEGLPGALVDLDSGDQSVLNRVEEGGPKVDPGIAVPHSSMLDNGH